MKTALCYSCIHIKIFLNSTLHYSREAILGFSPNKLHVGQRILSLLYASSTGSTSILATVTKTEWVVSRLLPAYSVSVFPQKFFETYGLKALQVLSIVSVSVENIQPVSRDRVCLYCYSMCQWMIPLHIDFQVIFLVWLWDMLSGTEVLEGLRQSQKP